MQEYENDSIKVYARFRPTDEQSLHLEFFKDDPSVMIDFEKRQFGFHHIFSTDSDSNNYLEVFSKVTSDILEQVNKGYNGTIFAYGQTGSGKTYTIVKEILPQASKFLWDKCQYENAELSLTAIQIFNEKISDLLTQKQDLNLRGIGNDFYVEDLYEQKITSFQQLVNFIKQSEQNRNIGSTSMNLYSSRSHAIYTFTLIQKDKNLKSQLHLVDLSGSERLKKAKISSDKYNETISINQSLTTLSKCIIFLSDKKNQHIPFRESKLTKLLQNSLSGNSKTALIVNLSPRLDDLDETLASLCFGQRACKIVCKPIVNQLNKQSNNINLQQELVQKDKQISQLEYENNELQNQLLEYQELIQNLDQNRFSKKMYEELRQRYNALLDQFQEAKKILLEKGLSLSQNPQELQQSIEFVREEEEFFSQQKRADGLLDNLSSNTTPQNFDTFKQNDSQIQQANFIQKMKDLQKENEKLKEENSNLLEQVMATEYFSNKNDMNIFKTLNGKNVEISNLKNELKKVNEDMNMLKKQINLMNQEKDSYIKQISDLKAKNIKKTQKKRTPKKSIKTERSIDKPSKYSGYMRIHSKKIKGSESIGKNLFKKDQGNNDVKKYQEEIQKLQNELQSYQKQIGIYQQELQEQNQTVVMLNGRIDTLIDGNNDQQKELNLLHKENKKLELRLANFNQQLVQQQNNMNDDQQREMDGLKNRIQILQQQIKSLQDQIKEHSNELFEINEQHQGELFQLNEKIYEQDTILYQKNEEIQELLKQKQNFDNEKEEMQNLFQKKLEDKIEELESVLNDQLQQKINEFVEQDEIQQTNKKNYQQQLDDQKDEILQLQDQIVQYTEQVQQIQILQDKIDEQIDQIQQLQEQVEILNSSSQNQEEQISKQMSELNFKDEQIKEMRILLQQRQQNDGSQDELKQLKVDKKNLKVKLNEKEKEILTIKGKIAKLQQDIEELNHFEIKYYKIQNEYQELENENQILKEQQINITSQQNQSENQQQLTNNDNKYQDELKQKNQQINEIKNKLDETVSELQKTQLKLNQKNQQKENYDNNSINTKKQNYNTNKLDLQKEVLLLQQNKFLLKQNAENELVEKFNKIQKQSLNVKNSNLQQKQILFQELSQFILSLNVIQNKSIDEENLKEFYVSQLQKQYIQLQKLVLLLHPIIIHYKATKNIKQYYSLKQLTVFLDEEELEEFFYYISVSKQRQKQAQKILKFLKTCKEKKNKSSKDDQQNYCVFNVMTGKTVLKELLKKSTRTFTKIHKKLNYKQLYM